MNILRLILTVFILMGVFACAPAATSSPPEELAVAPTEAVSSPALLLPTSTAMTLPSGYPEPPTPEPPLPEGYPAPVAAPPTETPEPLPMVDTLPLTWTWFVDSSGLNGRCDYSLFARSAEGELVQFNQRIRAVVARPEATPLLLTCTPIGGDDSRNLEIRAVDIEAGTSVLLPIDTIENNYQLSLALLAPDGQHIIFEGSPSRDWDVSDPEQFWGMYRADLSSGEVVQFIRFSRDPEAAYGGAAIGWDFHIPGSWDETGLVVHTTASGNNDLWRFTWDENAPLPYSVEAGTLTVELLDSEVSWYEGMWDAYDEPSLPARFQQPVLIYEPPS